MHGHAVTLMVMSCRNTYDSDTRGTALASSILHGTSFANIQYPLTTEDVVHIELQMIYA